MDHYGGRLITISWIINQPVGSPPAGQWINPQFFRPAESMDPVGRPQQIAPPRTTLAGRMGPASTVAKPRGVLSQ